MVPEQIKREPVCVIGAGPAGLVTAQVLLQDGFTNVTILTQDTSVGGVWAKDKVYPGMNINNVHGQFRFSSMEMAPPENAHLTGGRLTGSDMCRYMEEFHERFLKGKVRFGVRVVSIQRVADNSSPGWDVHVMDALSQEPREGERETERLRFRRIVLCTGGCNIPQLPPALTPEAAREAGFEGPVVHSSESWARMDEILQSAKAKTDATGNENATVVIVGGGKSAQDIAAYLASHDVKTTVVYRKADMFLASSKPMPTRIRQSRITSVLSPSIELRTRTEWFLHNTWLGAKLTRFFWDRITARSFNTYNIPEDSPLRLTDSVFWSTRTGDEGVKREDSYYAQVLKGNIKTVVPAWVLGFRRDGLDESYTRSESESESETTSREGATYLLTDTGEKLYASAVIVATGYKSSWDAMFSEEMMRDIGLTQDVSPADLLKYSWDYASLSDPPLPSPPSSSVPSTSSGTIVEEGSPQTNLGSSSSTRVSQEKLVKADNDDDDNISDRRGHITKAPALYKGLVPAKRLLDRDIAVNGAIVTSNAGYAWEVCAHWISSYFLSEPMRLPSTPDEAVQHTVRNLAWMERRFPGSKAWSNPSYGSWLPHWAWPQAIDDLLEDMYLSSQRSGGSWLTWLLQPIQIEEIKELSEERRVGIQERKRKYLGEVTSRT